jgi:hypothetical protein
MSVSHDIGREGASSAASPAKAASCEWHALLDGAPSRSLLASFAILRRPSRPGDEPASLVAQFSRPLQRQIGQEVYVQYIRYARTVDGVAYYLVPTTYRCGLIHQSTDGLALDSAQGGGGGGPDAAAIARTGGWSSRSGGTGADPGRTTFIGLLPDGVTSVTLHYPAGKLGGFSHRNGPAITVTEPVVNNVVVITVERAGNQARSNVTTTWHGENGSVVKVIHGGL